MAVGQMCPDGERGVEEQHTLTCPTGEIAICRHRLAEVGLYLLEDVDKRRRHDNALRHREAQPHGLSLLVIRILPDDHHLHLVEGTEVESVEDQMARREALLRLVFFFHLLGEAGKVRLVKLRAQVLFPGRFYLYVHNEKSPTSGQEPEMGLLSMLIIYCR